MGHWLGGTWCGHNFRILAYVNEGEIITIDEEGYPQFTFDEPAALEVLEQFRIWYELGVVCGDFCFGNNVAMDFGQYIARAAHVNNANLDLGLVPLPWGPSSVRDIYPLWGCESEFLPTTVEDPLGMIALHSFIFRPEDAGEFNDYLIRDNGEFAMTAQDAAVAHFARKNSDARAFTFETILRNETSFYQAVDDAIKRALGMISGKDQQSDPFRLFLAIADDRSSTYITFPKS